MTALPRGTLLAAVVVLFAGFAARADDIPAAEKRSGYEQMGPGLRRMQDDDSANPGMLWVLDGETLWQKRDGTAGKSCADCHSDAGHNMKGVAARYPMVDGGLNAPIDLEGRINACRTNHQ